MGIPHIKMGLQPQTLSLHHISISRHLKPASTNSPQALKSMYKAVHVPCYQEKLDSVMNLMVQRWVQDQV